MTKQWPPCAILHHQLAGTCTDCASSFTPIQKHRLGKEERAFGGKTIDCRPDGTVSTTCPTHHRRRLSSANTCLAIHSQPSPTPTPTHPPPPSPSLHPDPLFPFHTDNVAPWETHYIAIYSAIGRRQAYRMIYRRQPCHVICSIFNWRSIQLQLLTISPLQRGGLCSSTAWIKLTKLCSVDRTPPDTLRLTLSQTDNQRLYKKPSQNVCRAYVCCSNNIESVWYCI